jgi:hypothetical protein
LVSKSVCREDSALVTQGLLLGENGFLSSVRDQQLGADAAGAQNL